MTWSLTWWFSLLWHYRNAALCRRLGIGKASRCTDRFGRLSEMLRVTFVMVCAELFPKLTPNLAKWLMTDRLLIGDYWATAANAEHGRCRPRSGVVFSSLDAAQGKYRIWLKKGQKKKGPNKKGRSSKL